MLRYTSGFVLSGSEVGRLCEELNLYYGSPDGTSVPASRAISRHMASVDRHLKEFPLQPVSLRTKRGPEAVWMLPTSTTRTPVNIDPETRANTVIVKQAVMATGIREEYLNKFTVDPRPTDMSRASSLGSAQNVEVSGLSGLPLSSAALEFPRLNSTLPINKIIRHVEQK
ncbi:hypothetical protein FRC10_007781, partial [Ceratobasidium sp. 414]